MYQMFRLCKSLEQLDLRSFTTPLVENMSYMFTDSNNLTNINLSGFVADKVTTTEIMLSGCVKLTTIDLRNFELSGITTYTNMFKNVPTATIYLKDTQTNRDFMSTNFSSYTNVQYITPPEESN